MTKLRDENSHVRSLSYLITLALVKKSSGHQRIDIGEHILPGMGVDALAGVDDLSQEHLALEVRRQILLNLRRLMLERVL